jgi:Ca-activated chloride channel family protein
MILKHPGFLWLFLIFIPLIIWYIWKHKNANATLSISSTGTLAKVRPTGKIIAMHLEFALRLVCIAAVIVALCRPQSYDSFKTSQVEGTDIALALDISGSMSVRDMGGMSRIQAAKEVASKFVNSREDDNMALVIFAGESLSRLPLTNERAALLSSIGDLQFGLLHDGTAIGDGITSSINRLLQGKAKSKSIILITDGTNNAGDVAPSTAAEIARQNGIRIYTIGVGTDGSVSIPDPYGYSTTVMETKIDEDALKAIANTTGGKYFRARDRDMLEQVFKEIDKLEKTQLEVQRHSQAEEAFMPWVLLALVAFVLEMVLYYVVVRQMP